MYTRHTCTSHTHTHSWTHSCRGRLPTPLKGWSTASERPKTVEQESSGPHNPQSPAPLLGLGGVGDCSRIPGVPQVHCPFVSPEVFFRPPETPAPTVRSKPPGDCGRRSCRGTEDPKGSPETRLLQPGSILPFYIFVGTTDINQVEVKSVKFFKSKLVPLVRGVPRDTERKM